MSWGDWIFPRKCIGCGKEGKYICESCEVGMWEEEQTCPICCRNSRYGQTHERCKGSLEGLVCHFAYEGMVKKLIVESKYRYFYKELEEMMDHCQKLWERPEFFHWKQFMDLKPILVPVPLFKEREKERGFNQAKIIAHSLAARNSVVINSNLLLRVKKTERQVGRSREERLKAMEGAFQINPKFKNQTSNQTQNSNFKNILLVDDVWTTGATMRECAKTLKKALPNCQIWGWVIAR